MNDWLHFLGKDELYNRTKSFQYFIQFIDCLSIFSENDIIRLEINFNNEK